MDSMGTPLSGASVTNRRTKKTVQTDPKGEFVIAAEEGDELTVSYIGFEKKTWNVNNNFQNVFLKPYTSPLDEVQIKAYGTISRRLNTGNISTVSSKEIAQQPVNNPLLALAARVPGLEIIQSTGIAGGDIIKYPS
jgi:TonB-dependent starch-binding outer membrane protein SusC